MVKDLWYCNINTILRLNFCVIDNSPVFSLLWRNVLREPIFQKLYFLFIETLNKKEDKETCTICFEVRKRKWKIWKNGSVKRFCQTDGNNWANIKNKNLLLQLVSKIFKYNSLAWPLLVFKADASLRYGSCNSYSRISVDLHIEW